MTLIPFPLTRRRAQIAQEALRASVAACDPPVELIHQVGARDGLQRPWFAVRIRPPGVVVGWRDP